MNRHESIVGKYLLRPATLRLEKLLILQNSPGLLLRNVNVKELNLFVFI